MNMVDNSVVIPSSETEETIIVIPAYEKEEISVVIPSVKKRVFTLEFNAELSRFNVKVVRGVKGLAKAFNECYRGVDSEIIVLLADDIVLDPAVYDYFSQVRKGEFAMLETGDFPINGVQIIHRDDFWRVGGFNEALKYSSVDREFYARAVLSGLKYRPIPLRLVKHIKHETRASNIYKAFMVVRDNMTFMLRYFRFFPLRVLKHDFLNRVRRLQLRTLVLQFFYFFRIVIRG
jgi:GT2 family glycosyltransferase